MLNYDKKHIKDKNIFNVVSLFVDNKKWKENKLQQAFNDIRIFLTENKNYQKNRRDKKQKEKERKKKETPIIIDVKIVMPAKYKLLVNALDLVNGSILVEDFLVGDQYYTARIKWRNMQKKILNVEDLSIFMYRFDGKGELKDKLNRDSAFLKFKQMTSK